MKKTEPIACDCCCHITNHDPIPCSHDECTHCTPLKGDWKERFDEIGFGNQAFIVGAKRVELKDFIQSLLDTQKQEYISRLEEDKENIIGSGITNNMQQNIVDGVNRAIRLIKE